MKSKNSTKSRIGPISWLTDTNQALCEVQIEIQNKQVLHLYSKMDGCITCQHWADKFF